MWRIVWSRTAINKLVALRTYLGEISDRAASRAEMVIYKAVDRLLLYPNAGKKVPELDGVRQIYIRFGASGYALRYKLSDNKIYVLTLKHYREQDFFI